MENYACEDGVNLPVTLYVCRLEVAHDNKKSYEQVKGFTIVDL